MFFESWTGLGRILLVGTLGYIALVAILRISGKRTLTKLNAFDLVVTVALGSTLATVLLSKSVALAEGVLAMVLLVFLQFAITWLSVRVSWVNGLIKSEPTLLVHNGQFPEQALRSQRVTKDDVLSALRSSGAGDVASITAIVLETDGSMSVLKGQSEAVGSTTLVNVTTRSQN